MNLQENGTGNFLDAADYLNNGIRNIPLNTCLLYNYACVNERLGRFGTAIVFFNFVEQLRPTWIDCLYGQSVTYFKIGKY